MAPAAGASGRCWRLLIRCLHSGSSYQPAPVAVTARAFYKMASSMEAGQPLSRVQELRTMPACNVDGGVRWISSIQSPCMEIVTETGREDQDDGENVREGEDRKGQYPGSAAINLEEASLDLQTLNSSASKGAFFFGNDWQLMSTEAQVCSRAMSNLQNSEPYLGSPRYQPHEAKHGNPKGTGAWAAGSVTMSRTFAGQYGGSYLKALLVATNNGRTTTGIRLEYTHSSTYTLADVAMAKPDALYPRVVELGDNKRYRFDKAGLQPAILEMPDRPMHASRIANAWSSCIFHRGGTASIGVSNLLKAQTRSYKTRMANRSIRDQKKRLLVQQYEMKRAHYKAICHDRSLPSQVRYEFGLKLSKLPRNSSKTRLKNRCVFTGRSHSVYRKFGISRIVFRELASRGALTGVNKASW